jgi:ADP-ribose pyrophosphatase
MGIKKGPWTLVSSKDVYSNPWIKVKEDNVIGPDGKDGIFGVVTMKSGVSVLPIDNQNNVFLTREYHYAVERETIEAVSGGIDGSENKLEAAKRELKEETGIEAKEWMEMGVVDPFTTVINSPNYLFLAKNLTFSEANPEGTERIKVIKIPFKQAVDWVMQSLITHSATTTLILKVKNYLP